MGDILIMILGWTLVGFGFLGCFVNKIPGPLLTFLGLLTVVLGTSVKCEWWVLLLIGLMVVASMILNKRVVPLVAKKVAEYGKAGSWGTTIGSIIGIIVLGAVGVDSAALAISMIILAFLVLPYVFAFLLEFVARKTAGAGARAAGGALVAFLAGTMLKLAVCVASVYVLIA